MVIRMKYYGRQKFLLIRLPHIGELSNQCKADLEQLYNLQLFLTM